MPKSWWLDSSFYRVLQYIAVRLSVMLATFGDKHPQPQAIVNTMVPWRFDQPWTLQFTTDLFCQSHQSHVELSLPWVPSLSWETQKMARVIHVNMADRFTSQRKCEPDQCPPPIYFLKLLITWPNTWSRNCWLKTQTKKHHILDVGLRQVIFQQQVNRLVQVKNLPLKFPEHLGQNTFETDMLNLGVVPCK